MKRLFVACFLVSAVYATYYDNARDYSYRSVVDQSESSWKLLEQMIILKPEHSVSTLLGKGGATLFTATVLGYLGYLAGKKLIGTSTMLTSTASLGAGSICGLFSYNGIRSFLLNREEHAQLQAIMKIWDQMSTRVPREVYMALDNLHTAWITDKASYNDQADIVLSFLKAEIHGRYPYTYKKKSGTLFSSRNLNVHVMLDAHRIIDGIISLIRSR